MIFLEEDKIGFVSILVPEFELKSRKPYDPVRRTVSWQRRLDDLAVMIENKTGSTFPQISHFKEVDMLRIVK
jgi:hypothetical protein